jgi:hypothetical protein
MPMMASDLFGCFVADILKRFGGSGMQLQATVDETVHSLVYNLG